MRSLLQKVHTQVSVTMSEVSSDGPGIRSIETCGRDQLIAASFQIQEAAERYAHNAKLFYYQSVLYFHKCHSCAGRLVMQSESKCRCLSCNAQFDPTVAFLRCSACGGAVRLQVRRYACVDCGSDVPSRFVFDGLVFDCDYFRCKMAEHRERKRERLARVRELLSGSCSGRLDLQPLEEAPLANLFDALAGIEAAPSFLQIDRFEPIFDLPHYQRHLQAHASTIALTLDELSPLSENRRISRIGCFIAAVFLAHLGVLRIWQDGPDVMIIQNETNRERQDLPGNLEEADGLEGSSGRIEA